LTLCNNRADDAQFGEPTPDNNIAKTLDIIRQTVQAGVAGSDGSCAVVVVNVMKDAFITTGVLPGVVGPDGKIALSRTIIGDLRNVSISTDDETIINGMGGYVLGKDYTLDRFGNFKDITGTYLGADLNFSCSYFDISDMVAADIIGESAGDGMRTGTFLFDLVESRWGFKPKIFISPVYNTMEGMAERMEGMATANRGEYLTDIGPCSVSDALAARGSGMWATSNPAVRPCYPRMFIFDNFANTYVAYPYAAVLAGMYVANDRNVGAWQSVSNQEMSVVFAPEGDITCGISDEGSEATLLNAAGIITYRKAYGTGVLTWGNRNASYPSSTDVTNFSNIYRMDGMVADAMEKAAAPRVDKGITKAWIDIMKQVGMNLINTLIQQGAILPGSYVTYRKQDNQVQDLANGKVVFYRNYMIPPPAEGITFASELNINLLGSVG
jgi:phage tail sheath protein FI